MPDYRRILFIATADVRQTPAFLRALHLARASGATLFLELFDYAPAVDAIGVLSAQTRELAHRAWLQDRQAWLEAQANAVHIEGVRIEPLAHWAHPAHRTALDRILDLDPDLVVKDTRRETLVDRILLHPLDWHLIHECAAPLLLVARNSQPPRRIIAAVDPSHGWNRRGNLNACIARAAASLAGASGATLEYAHAFEGVPPVVANAIEAAAGDMAAAFEAYRETHRSQFDALADSFQARPDQRRFLLGPTPQALAELARAPGDVIALGTVRQSPLEKLAIGSVAEAILNQLHCDALVVKPEGFRQNAVARRAARDLAMRQPPTEGGRRLTAS